MTSALPIEMVSDVVCPWCFIGKRRLEKAIALRPDIAVEVRFWPYFLNPWVPREGISRKDYLSTKFGSPERYRSIAQRVAPAVPAAAQSGGGCYPIDFTWICIDQSGSGGSPGAGGSAKYTCTFTKA